MTSVTPATWPDGHQATDTRSYRYLSDKVYLSDISIKVLVVTSCHAQLDESDIDEISE